MAHDKKISIDLLRTASSKQFSQKCPLSSTRNADKDLNESFPVEGVYRSSPQQRSKPKQQFPFDSQTSPTRTEKNEQLGRSQADLLITLKTALILAAAYCRDY